MNNRCATRSRRSINTFNHLRARRTSAIAKRQTGTYDRGILPTELFDFENCMMRCEKRLSHYSDDEKKFYIAGDIRGGVVDAILTCTKRLECEINAFVATDAHVKCAQEYSAQNADNQLVDCVQFNLYHGENSHVLKAVQSNCFTNQSICAAVFINRNLTNKFKHRLLDKLKNILDSFIRNSLER